MSQFKVFIDGVQMAQFEAEHYLLSSSGTHFVLDAVTPQCDQHVVIRDGKFAEFGDYRFIDGKPVRKDTLKIEPGVLDG